MKFKFVVPETVYDTLYDEHASILVAPIPIGFPEQAVLAYNLSKLRIEKSTKMHISFKVTVSELTVIVRRVLLVASEVSSLCCKETSYRTNIHWGPVNQMIVSGIGHQCNIELYNWTLVMQRST